MNDKGLLILLFGQVNSQIVEGKSPKKGYLILNIKPENVDDGFNSLHPAVIGQP